MQKLFFVLTALSYSVCSAQLSKQDSVIRVTEDILYMDSLRLYHRRTVSFDFQLDNRNSFVKNQAIEITGFNPAVIINQKFRYGLGIYFVKFPYETFVSTKGSSVSSNKTVTNRELQIFFATPNFRYLIVNNRWIQAAPEIAIGFGTIDYIIRDKDNTEVLTHKSGLFVPSGVGFEMVLIPVRYLGVGGSIGYRKSLGTYDVNADFDGMYYSYGIKIFLGRIYKDMKYRSWRKQTDAKILDIRKSFTK